MKHLGIDLGYLLDQYGHRGIGRYTREVASRLLLNSSDEIFWHIFGFDSWEQTAAELRIDPQQINQVEFYKIGEAGAKTPLENLNNFYRRLRPKVAKLSAAANLDLFYSPYFEHGLPVGIPNLKVAVTIHDAIPVVTGNFSQKSNLHNFGKGLFYKSFWYKQLEAGHIFTDSNTTKQDLLELGFPTEKLETVYLGIGKEFFEAEEKGSNLSYLQQLGIKELNYILYDSGLEENKNVKQLVTLFKSIHESEPELKLVITGSSFNQAGEPLNDLADHFVELCLEAGLVIGPGREVVTAGKVSESELLRLFASAKAYVNLSNAEGFGLGPLQAMAAGVPAIISDNPCFVEVSGPAAHIVSMEQISKNPSQVVRGIIELLRNREELEVLTTSGLKHAPRFNWDDTADQIARRLQALIS